MDRWIEKHIYFHEAHIDVLDEIIQTNPEIKNYSQAVRFLCMTYNPEASAKSGMEASERLKLNAIGKEISIVATLLGEIADVSLKENGIIAGKESHSYKEAERLVEQELKRKTTIKNSPKKIYQRPEPIREEKKDSNPFSATNLLK